MRWDAVAIAAVLVGFAAPAAPAGAQAGADDALTLDDVGDGRCTPDPVVPGATTDCSFELARAVPLDPDGGPYLLEAGRSTGPDLPHCHVEGDRLRCPDVRVHAPGPDGDRTRSQTLVFGDRRRQDAVTVEAADIGRRARVRIADHAVVTPGVPLRYATPDDLPDDTWLQATRRYDTEVVATFEVENTGGWSADPVEVPAQRLGLDAGSYRLGLCTGPTAANCQPTGWSTTLQVIDEALQPLVAGHDLPRADRINLVVAGYGFDDEDAFAEVAAMALDPADGLVLVDAQGRRLEPDSAQQAGESGQRVAVHFSFFDIEPFADAADQFNVWVLPEQLDHPDSLWHRGAFDAPPWIEGFTMDGHELANVSVVTLAQDPPGADPGSRAASNDLHEIEGPIERDDDGEVGFSGSTTWLDPDTPWQDLSTVAHELGHALFGLRDEYPDPSSTAPRYGYPNCAESRDQAQRWWGDLIGQLDPMTERYRRAIETYQPGLRDISDDLLAEWAAVGVHEHPCGSAADAPSSFVPTQRGLMAYELPILGSVNRARAEQVLGMFSGRPEDDATTTPTATPTPSPTTSPSPAEDATRSAAPTAPDATPTPAAAPSDGDGGIGGRPVVVLAAIGVLVAAAGLWVWQSRRAARTRGG